MSQLATNSLGEGGWSFMIFWGKLCYEPLKGTNLGLVLINKLKQLRKSIFDIKIERI
jgi:hypothetical protein